MKKKGERIKQANISIPATIQMVNSIKTGNNFYQQTSSSSNKREQDSRIQKKQPGWMIHQKHHSHLQTYQAASESKQTLQDHKKLQNKMTRSISSFNRFKPLRDQAISKAYHQVSSNKSGNNNNNSTQRDSLILGKICQTFTQNTKNRLCQANSQQNLIKSIEHLFQQLQIIVQQSAENYQYAKMVKCFKGYLHGVINQFISFQEIKIKEYTQKLQIIVNQYDDKYRKIEKATEQKIYNNLKSSSTSIGNFISSLKAKTYFSTAIFNEMGKSGIDIEGWIKNSQLMQNFVGITASQNLSQNNLISSQYQSTTPNKHNLNNKAQNTQQLKLNLKLNEQQDEKDYALNFDYDKEDIGQNLTIGKNISNHTYR